MVDEAQTLPELMLYATQFCLKVETLIADSAPNSERDEARLKLSQGRNILELLQTSFNDGKLDLGNPTVHAEFRVLIIHLLWAAFRVRDIIDLKTFRILVQLEAAFTFMLTQRALS
jgi:hypothetical protein